MRLFRILHEVENWLLVVILGVMILIAFGQIFLRNAAGTGLTWIDPLNRHLVLWIALGGAMVAAREDGHLSMDLLAHLLPPRWASLSRMITGLFTAVVCAVLCYHSIRYIGLEMDFGTLAFARVPAWWFELVIPLGFGVTALRYIARSARDAKKALHQGEHSEEHTGRDNGAKGAGAS